MFIKIIIILIVLGLIFCLAGAHPYIYYIIKIKNTPQKNVSNKKNLLPNISIVINAYKEGELVSKRIDDIINSDYPKEKITLYVINDGADKETGDFTKKALCKCNFKTRLIEPKKRLGKAVCQNNTIDIIEDEIIIFTDADITTKEDAITILVETLLQDNIGAVCADLIPVGDNKSVTGSETAYRSIYGKMCEYDSSIDSTYNFNGPLIAFKKSVVKYINETIGADDANLALECIKNGYRAVYASKSVAFELQPVSIKEQFNQKIRRADGLVNSTRLFKSAGKGSERLFWKKIFPVRKWMLLYSPILFIISIIFLLIGFYLLSIIYGIVFSLIIISLIILSILKPKNILSSFILNQIFLTVGLVRRKNILLWDRVNK